jgi:radical SAM superfamily enzyme YgiQ (UPF0313 family)
LKKVLLVSINKCVYPYPVYPLGISHLGAALSKGNYDVAFLDLGVSDQQLEATISDYQPDFVCLSMRNIDDIRIDNPVYFIPELEKTTLRVRAICKAPVIIGGSAFSLFPEVLYKLTGADYGIVSEGEVSLVMLLDTLSQMSFSHDALSAIPGLVYKNSSGIHRNPCKNIDPDRIPDALREPLFESYYSESSGVINIQSQRGCPCRCCYCTYPVIEGRIPRYRPVKNVVDELLESKKRGHSYFFMVDSVFNTSKDHVYAFCEELISRNVQIKWSCFLKPSNLDESMMAILAKAGLTHIEFGTDSFSDIVLDAYGKDFTFNDIYNASEWARANNIHYAHFLICGGPGETEATLNESFVNSQRLKKTIVFPFVGMRLYPNTALYKRALDEHIITPDTNLLEPFFYIAPSITKGKINTQLRSFHEQMPNWMIDDAPPEIVAIMKKLRLKGIKGPLWEFLVR